MSSYKLTFKLKQITPMIHFQWDEDGACIRGSELKPKFDKFILANRHLYEDDSLRINDACFIDKEKDALNYKVRIVPCAGNKEVSQTIERDIEIAAAKSRRADRREISQIRNHYKDINVLYFGNMARTADGMRETYKESIRYAGGVEITFVCSNSSLREIIKPAFEDFIAVTNFGTRQNKGFGCFITNDLNKEKQIQILQKMKNAFFYCETTEEDKLTLVDAIYSCMKGGKNMNDTYVASFIQKHYLQNGKQSDKAFIKSQGLFAGDSKESNPGHYEFVRALLGLADHIDFKDPQNNGEEKHDGDTVKRVGTVTIKSVDKEIDRYKSPFTVKILDDSIFFIYEDTFERIKGKKFKFQGNSNPRNNRETVINRESDEISVPNEFDIDDFIKRFVQYCNGTNQDGELKKYEGIPRYKKAANLKLIAPERKTLG